MVTPVTARKTTARDGLLEKDSLAVKIDMTSEHLHFLKAYSDNIVIIFIFSPGMYTTLRRSSLS